MLTQEKHVILIVFNFYLKGNINENRLPTIFLDESTTDVRFIFDYGESGNESQEIVPAHKIILALYSPVFRTMFYGSLPEPADIRITDATPHGFTELIRFIYCNEVILTVDSADEIVYLAKKYEVNDLLAACTKYLLQKMSMDQLCTGLELALKYGMLELEQFCVFRIIQHHGTFFESDAFAVCGIDFLKVILSCDSLRFYSYEMFKACIRCTQNTFKQKLGIESELLVRDVGKQLNDCFDLIEFGSMTSQEIVSILAEYGDCFSPSDLATIHKILADKYPMSLGSYSELRCDLKVYDIQDKKYSIEEVGKIRFQSNKKLFFVGYSHAAIYSDDWIEKALFIGVTVIKKSNVDQGKDIALLRQKHGALYNSDIVSIEPETLAIEPNTKYEIRLTLLSSGSQKYYFKTAYMPKISQGGEEVVSIDPALGHSIISSLVFKY